MMASPEGAKMRWTQKEAKCITNCQPVSLSASISILAHVGVQGPKQYYKGLTARPRPCDAYHNPRRAHQYCELNVSITRRPSRVETQAQTCKNADISYRHTLLTEVRHIQTYKQTGSQANNYTDRHGNRDLQTNIAAASLILASPRQRLLQRA
jgi:hypothetical protein